ncbi:carboxymuconolactone decarboxylase family protein [Klebsiella aerogenes]|uniref:carboxymuconolactone decarboxylase family protein n=2 Tax=Klebsiella aerogenes TaxID=548 RepID=UPI002228428A|nr:carboxymuconolactone decarboxylase family protein [Klebsiella aerogenes]
MPSFYNLFSCRYFPFGEQTMQNPLNARQQALIPVAALAAEGNIAALAPALDTALDTGLTINELKETLVQLYAYCGFPRSLNALSCLMKVITERQARGVIDNEGATATPLPENWDSLQAGSRNQTQLVGQTVSGPLFEFAPAIDCYLKAHLFGDIFQRDVLDWPTRELATISMLAALSGVESQLKSHYAISLHNGLTAQQLRGFIDVLATKVSAEIAAKASAVLEQVAGS